MKFTIAVVVFVLSVNLYGLDLRSSMNSMNASTFKVLLSKKPSEIEPELAIIVGGIYQYGMKELSVIPNINKAKKYYSSGATRGAIMGYLLLANIAATENNYTLYETEMTKLINANDEKLSHLGGLQLAAYYTSNNKTPRAVETLLLVADMYDEPRAQFMIGWSIVTKSYIPKGLSAKDGDFYLYQACNNPKRTNNLQQKCVELKIGH